MLACAAAALCSHHATGSRGRPAIKCQQLQKPEQPGNQGRLEEAGPQVQHSARKPAVDSRRAAGNSWAPEQAVLQRAKEGAALTAVSVALVCMLIKGLEDDG